MPSSYLFIFFTFLSLFRPTHPKSEIKAEEKKVDGPTSKEGIHETGRCQSKKNKGENNTHFSYFPGGALFTPSLTVVWSRDLKTALREAGNVHERVACELKRAFALLRAIGEIPTRLLLARSFSVNYWKYQFCHCFFSLSD